MIINIIMDTVIHLFFVEMKFDGMIQHEDGMDDF